MLKVITDAEFWKDLFRHDHQDHQKFKNLVLAKKSLYSYEMHGNWIVKLINCKNVEKSFQFIIAI